MDNEFMNEYNRHNKRSNVMLIILITIVVLVGVYFGGKFLIKSFDSKLVFVDFFDDIFEGLEGSFSVYSDEFKDNNIQVDDNFSLSFDTKDEMNLNSFGINIISQYDFENSETFMDLKYLENEEEVTNLQMFFEQQDTYLYFKDLYDKVLKINNDSDESDEILKESIDSFNRNININDTDIERLLKLTKEIVSNNINEDNFFRSKENVTIENIEYKLDKHSYILEGKEYNEFIIDILTDIKNNSEYIDLLVKIFDLDKDDINNVIKEVIDEQRNSSDNVKVEFIIYTKGLFREVVGFGFNFIDNDEQSKFRIRYFNIDESYKMLLEDEYESFSEEDSYYLIEGKKQDDIIKLSYKENGELKANITYKNIGSSMELVISEPDGDNAMRLYISSLAEEKLVTSNISFEYTNNEVTIKLEYNSKVSPVEDILKIDYENMINIDDLTEDEQLKIEENMMKIMEKSKLFNTLFESYNSDYYLAM